MKKKLFEHIGENTFKLISEASGADKMRDIDHFNLYNDPDNVNPEGLDNQKLLAQYKERNTMRKMPRYKLGKDISGTIIKSQWWEVRKPEEIAIVQFFVLEEIVPFVIFYNSVVKAVDNPRLSYDDIELDRKALIHQILNEYYGGKTPTIENIFDIIKNGI
ncbi:MAG TPA: hypothetical protein PL028_05860 [Bacteroidales bacterium]|nr:hypothetical protein [Bacteroidales bacterium]